MKRTAGIALLTLCSLSAQAGPADPGLLVGVSGMLTSYEIDGDVFDDEAVGGKLSVQYRINRYIGIEGSWLDSGNFSEDTNPAGPGGGVDVDLHGITIQAIGYLPMPSEDIQVYGKGGIYDFDQNLDTDSGSSSRGADGLTFGAGAQIAVSSKVSLRLEGDWFDLDGGDFWTVSLGVNWHFGPL
ncbi:MAG: outer membrane beta-barrel protein [Gammaproteobacteria bacterium]|nr:outer membrane beta-barrel protein [Gammaproteobacteria bacterium]